MIFAATLDKVLSGEKTQTRRVIKPGDELRLMSFSHANIHVYNFNERVRWQVGKTYAVQPGRGKKAVGRIKITAIRRERLQDITEQDAKAEGCYSGHNHIMSPDPDKDRWVTFSAVDQFCGIWQSLNYPPGKRWEDNPEVWVIEFERAA